MRSLAVDLLMLKLAEPAGGPRNRQLYEALRTAILDGSIAPGQRLPASRDLAAGLGIARNTVVHAYQQLLDEGYISARQGSGTYVRDSVPEPLPAGVRPARAAPAGARPLLSPRGARLVADASASPRQWGAFMPGVPDVTAFPHRRFGRIVAGLWRRPAPELLSYGYGGGLPALREALAAHLRVARALDCDAGQVLITEGSHQAMDLTARLLGEPGDRVWLEDPGYWGARAVLASNGLTVRPMPLDEEGMTLPTEPGELPRLIFVTPSHQYPMGTVMSLARRRQLLSLAERWGSWIIEDDYDSEFRYSGRPIASLQGLQPDAPVIYVGTFSKTLYPGLRIGYMVLPRELAPSFRAAHAELYREGHLLTQAALAAFIADGHYGSHIRRMRLIYARRRDMLAHLVRRRLGDEWLGHDSQAGLHLVLRLPEGMDDAAAARAAAARGVLTRALSAYYAQPGLAGPGGLMLGYGCVADAQIAPSFERLLQALADCRRQACGRAAARRATAGPTR